MQTFVPTTCPPTWDTCSALLPFGQGDMRQEQHKTGSIMGWAFFPRAVCAFLPAHLFPPFPVSFSAANATVPHCPLPTTTYYATHAHARPLLVPYLPYYDGPYITLAIGLGYVSPTG